MSTRILVITSALLALPAALHAQTVREATGANAAAIQATVDAFRADLGTVNANQPGSLGAGRREINWDGVPANPDVTLDAPGVFPGDFFNANLAGRARGVVFTTPGNLFQVSAATTDPAVVGALVTPEFGNINVNYPAQFEVFSAQRLFVPLGANSLSVGFFVPGSTTPATTRGFGAVFTDVDTVDAARIEYYDQDDTLLLSRSVLPTAQGLSFLGVSFAEPVIASVVIVTGTAAPGPNDITDDPAGPDIVALDDFIYGEPIALPEITIDSVTVTEGNTGTTTAELTVTLSAASTEEVTASYSVVDGLATALDNDFETAVGTVTFPAGETTQTVSVDVNGDTKREPNETFFVILATPAGATLAQDRGVVTIVDDDPVPTVSVTSPSVAERDRGAILQFTVSLSNASSLPVTVNYQTANGTAVEGQDYRAESGTLTLAAGETARGVPVLILGDDIDEQDETFLLALSNAANAQLPGGTQGVGTIVDDDPPGGGQDNGPPGCAVGSGVALMAAGLGLMLQLWQSRRSGLSAGACMQLQRGS